VGEVACGVQEELGEDALSGRAHGDRSSVGRDQRQIHLLSCELGRTRCAQQRLRQLLPTSGLRQPRRRRVDQGQTLHRRQPRFPLGSHMIIIS